MSTKNELRAEIEVNAAPATVWSVLMDFEAYAEWNPFITRIEGGQAVGDRLAARLQPVGGRGITMRPSVTVNEPTTSFGWLGRLGIPHIFDGAHRFTLEPLDDGHRTHFVQSESFRGILLPFLRRKILPGTLKGFDAMNRALAARAESMQTQGV
jgi:hypothetical protein